MNGVAQKSKRTFLVHCRRPVSNYLSSWALKDRFPDTSKESGEAGLAPWGRNTCVVQSRGIHISLAQRARAMATATMVKVSTSDAGVFNVGPTAQSAQKATEVLQEDLEKHHIFFNNLGFHSMCV